MVSVRSPMDVALGGAHAVPGFHVLRELGRGGMATVHLAIQDSLGREVALKLISPLFSADVGAVERFLREARIAAKLVDRHIVGIHDVGVHDGQAYIAMEYMPGGAVVAAAPRAPLDALQIVHEIALALDHAHREGVIHRDIKPENILRRADGSYALSDFGIARTFDSTAKLTREGIAVGTPHYMSPEQLQGFPLDGRSDLYSLGIVLYQLLTGQLPIGAERLSASSPQPLPAHLRRCQPLMDRLLAQQPSQRPKDGAELAESIEALQAEFASVATPTRPLPVAAVQPRTLWRSAWALGAGLALVGALGVGLWRWHASNETARSLAPVPAGVADGSIAVLPLVNASGNKDEQFFSEGISENLIITLSQFPGLKVIGRNSAFQFRNTKDDATTIGVKLGVAHLLEGSVQHVGDIVRVSAELVRAADRSTLWSQHYDRPYTDLFALQDEIARAVATALKAKLIPGAVATAQSDRPPSEDLQAYDAYLRGRFYYVRNSEADIRKAIEHFTSATQIDPRYGQAWAWLSQARIVLASQFIEGTPAQQAYDKARTEAGTALALAPDLAAAHLARGMVLQTADFDWRGAESEYRRAAELAPDDGVAKQRLGYMLATLGQTEPAIDLTRQALASDPLNALWYVWLGRYLAHQDQLDEAEVAVRKGIELQPGAAGYYYQLTIIELQRGDRDAAFSAAEQEKPSIFRDIALALARQVGLDRAAADEALQGLIEKHAESAAFQIAQAYALRNDADNTFKWLNQAWAIRDVGVLYLLYDPFIARYREDPRFAAFCHKAGLPIPRQ